MVAKGPSKLDKSTANSYHACFRDLHWAINECHTLAHALELLEDYDGSQDSATLAKYSSLSCQIVAEHNRAYDLLKRLCGGDQEVPENPPPGVFGSLIGHLLSSLKVCGSRQGG